MKLSILLRTRNAERELGGFADCVQQGNEVVVVDHASTDGSRRRALEIGAAVRDYPVERNFSYGMALNLGIPLCTGEWVIVMSPHCEPLVSDFWTRWREILAGLPADVAACQAPVFLTTERKPAKQETLFFGPADLANVPWPLYGNTCCAYRREHLDRQPFDESLAASEDVEWSLRAVRAGHRIAIDFRVPVLYRSRAPLSRYWRKGRTDFPAVAAIYGHKARANPRRPVVDLLRETRMLLLGTIPFWLWIRLVVKRAAEFSLVFFPGRERSVPA